MTDTNSTAHPAQTIRDVANHSGFSTATVSRAINSPDKVDPQTLSAVQAAIAATGYRPSALGRMLRAGQSRVIGVVVPTIANPVFGETLQGIDEGAARAGFRLMLMTTEYDHERERVAIDTLREHRVDGLILTVADAVHNPRLDDLDLAGMPYVLAHNDARSSDGRTSVSVDNFAAARDGVRQMIAYGHQRISMLAGTLSTSDRAQQRFAGYAAAMREAGLMPAPVIEATFAAERLDARALVALTVGKHRPTALFCSNDRLAMVAISALGAANVKVPEHMSVMGFDGLSVGNWISPELSSICVPNREIGQQAWHCLQRLIERRTRPVAATESKSSSEEADSENALDAQTDQVERSTHHLRHTIRLGGTMVKLTPPLTPPSSVHPTL